MKRTERNDKKWRFPFVEYLPTEMSEKMPLIIQLHGAGERGNGGEELSLVDVHGFSKLVKDGEYPCIFIMPQCPKNDYWAVRVESILAFIEQLKAEYPVDEDRIYLTGLSMGGFGTWFTATASPSTFAAIAPVCGGGMAWAASTLTMPIWVFHGAEDKTVLPIYSDMMVEKLVAAGADVKYTRLDGVKHNAWDHAYGEELLLWLLSKKRN